VLARLDDDPYRSLTELGVIPLLPGCHDPQLPLPSRSPRYEGNLRTDPPRLIACTHQACTHQCEVHRLGSLGLGLLGLGLLGLGLLCLKQAEPATRRPGTTGPGRQPGMGFGGWLACRWRRRRSDHAGTETRGRQRTSKPPGLVHQRAQACSANPPPWSSSFDYVAGLHTYQSGLGWTAPPPRQHPVISAANRGTTGHGTPWQWRASPPAAGSPGRHALIRDSRSSAPRSRLGLPPGEDFPQSIAHAHDGQPRGVGSAPALPTRPRLPRGPPPLSTTRHAFPRGPHTPAPSTLFYGPPSACRQPLQIVNQTLRSARHYPRP
jgi:hypothetical protein